MKVLIIINHIFTIDLTKIYIIMTQIIVVAKDTLTLCTQLIYVKAKHDFDQGNTISGLGLISSANSWHCN